jgi:hypothetical protein
MKIRQGHVSNSSTSSFFGVGIALDTPKIKEKYLTDDIKEHLETTAYDDIYDTFIPWRAKEATPEIGKQMVNAGVEYANIDYEDTYIYVSFTKMKEDETLREFKNRVADLLTEVFDVPREAIGIVSYAWSNY